LRESLIAGIIGLGPIRGGVVSVGKLRLAFVAIVALSLGGCFSLVAEKPVPDWALTQSQPAEASDTAQKPKTARRKTQQRTARNAEVPTNSVPTGLSTKSGGASADYGPAWQAREKNLDDRLRQQLNICRGC
jgi:hypothetical protein